MLVQQTVSADVIAAIPSSRNASGIQSLIPGLNVSQAGVAVGGGDSGGIAGGIGGLAGTIHGGNTYGSRTKTDGLNTDFTGQAIAGGQLLNTAGASEVVINVSGGLGEAEGAGVILNITPKDGGNTFRGSAFVNGATGGMQGDNYTQSLKDQGLRAPSKLKSLYDWDAMGGGPIKRDKLWFYVTYRQVGSNSTVPGMWVNKNANNPNLWVVDFDLSQPAFTDSFDQHIIGRLTWQATRRNKLTFYWQEQYNYIGAEGGGTPTQTPDGTGLTLLQTVPHPAGHLDVSDQRQAAGGGGDRDLRGHVHPERRGRAAHRRHRRRQQSADDSAARTNGQHPELQLFDPGPDLPASRARERRIQRQPDRDAGMAGVPLVCQRRAQHEVRLPGRVQHADEELLLRQHRHPGPDEQRRAESNHGEPRLSRLASYRPPRHPRSTSTRRISGPGTG